MRKTELNDSEPNPEKIFEMSQWHSCGYSLFCDSRNYYDISIQKISHKLLDLNSS